MEGLGEWGAGLHCLPASSWVLSPELQVRNVPSCRLTLRPHPGGCEPSRGGGGGGGGAQAWGQSPSRRRTATGNTPSRFCTGKLGQSWYFSAGSQAPARARLLRVHQRAVLLVEVECGAHLPGWGGAQGPAVGQGSLQQSAPPCPFWKALPSGALWAGITSTPPPGGEAEAQTGAEGLPLHQLPAGGVQGEQETCLGRPLRG